MYHLFVDNFKSRVKKSLILLPLLFNDLTHAMIFTFDNAIYLFISLNVKSCEDCTFIHFFLLN